MSSGIIEKKYVLCPGKVMSKNDGDRHYVSAAKLAVLYNVDMRECEIYEPQPWWPPSYYRMAEERHNNMIMLRPRYDGNYSVPKTQPC